MWDRLKAAYKVLESNHYAVITVKDEDFDFRLYSKADLVDTFLLAMAVEKLHENIISELEKQSVDSGELRTLQALRQTVAAVEKELENGRNKSGGSKSPSDETE